MSYISVIPTSKFSFLNWRKNSFLFSKSNKWLQNKKYFVRTLAHYIANFGHYFVWMINEIECWPIARKCFNVNKFHKNVHQLGYVFCFRFYSIYMSHKFRLIWGKFRIWEIFDEMLKKWDYFLLEGYILVTPSYVNFWPLFSEE